MDSLSYDNDQEDGEFERQQHSLDNHPGESVIKFYLFGQLANGWKTAVWWSTFGVLLVALTGDDESIGIARTAFNLALILVSTFTGALTEHIMLKPLLVITSLFRLLIWGVLIPNGWILFREYLEWGPEFYVYLIFLMFLDGIQVSFEMVASMDSGGIELLSNQYDLGGILDESRRNWMNYLHQLFFDLSFLILSPPLALVLWIISSNVSDKINTMPWLNTDVFILTCGICLPFVIFSAASFLFYIFGLPRKQASSNDLSPEPFSFRVIREKSRERWRDIKEGFFLTKANRALACRVVFLAIETAFDDSMVSVIIPQIALHGTWIFNVAPSSTGSNLIAVLLIAVGKVGSSLAVLYMTTYWIPPTSFSRGSRYKHLFWCIFIACIFLWLLPIATYVQIEVSQFHWLADVLMFLGILMFFIFSAAPKIGFSALLQAFVTNQETAGAIFSFVGVFVMIVDAIVLVLLNLVFVLSGPEALFRSLIIIGIIFTFHGFCEALIGPYMILNSNAEDLSNSLLDSEQYRDNGSMRDAVTFNDEFRFTRNNDVSASYN